MKNLIIFLFIGVLLSLEAHSSSFIPKNFQAKFKKTVKSLVRSTTTEGTLSYHYPGRIKFVTDRTTVVSNGKKVWYYRPPHVKGEKGTLDISSAGRIKASGMFDALNSKKSKRYTRTVEGNLLTFTFKKKAAEEYGIKKIEFTDKNKKFKTLSSCQKMVIYYGKNKVETYELSEFDKKVKFHSSEFSFVVPDNTNIRKR